ncbi:tandem-95 repeat protein [Candidatus Bipolaricaulota bacterium]|nr:tandem-95 repeat protein [Candidatus Bipolaricaulota bacterium]
MIKQTSAVYQGRKLLIVASLLLVLILLMAIAADAQTFPRCISGCTANDVELVDVTAELLGAGSPGGSAEANLFVSLHFNRQKTYCVRFVADVYIDGDLAIADLVSEPMNVLSKGDYPDIYFGTVSLPYGSSLSLENVLVMWSVDKDYKDVADCEDGSCEPYGPKSKCTGDQYGSISVILPLEALDDAIEAVEDDSVTIDILANDILGLEPTEIIDLSNGARGTTQINRGGTVTYSPEKDFGGTDSFTYTIRDSGGNVASAVVTVIVVSHNDAPTAVDDTAQTNENESVQISILANDADADGSINPASITITKDSKYGTLSINPSNGVVTYTPDSRTCGDDNFEYTVQDNDGAVSDEASVDVTVRCNDEPIARDDAATTEEDVEIDIDILANDSDSDGSINPATVTITKDPKNGSARIDSTTGIVSYSPDSGACGDDYFKYTVADNDGGVSDEAKVELTVLCNEPPKTQDDDATTDENRSVNIDILANDSDPDGSIDPATLTITKDPKNGTISADPSTGVVSYVPDPGSCGDDYFRYTVADNDGAMSDEARVDISVICNVPPVAEDDEATTDENTSVGIHVAANDFDSDGTIDLATITITQQPQEGSISVHPSSGVITYTPNTGECDEDVFKYVVRDNDGRESNEATVIVEILCDDPPLAIDDLYSVGEGQTLNISRPGVLSNDIASPEHPLSVTLGAGVVHGILSLNGDGSFTYTHDGSETTSDEFTYLAQGGTKESNLATVTLIILPGNDAPTAQDDQGATEEDVPATLNVLTNDSDPDGDVLSVDWVTQPENGTVANNGRTVTYTPNPNFHGVDTFDYAATDGNGGQARATVTILVTPVNDPPVAQDDSASGTEDTPVTVSVLDNDSDPDGDGLAVQSVSQPSHGASTTNGSNVTYSPDPDFHGIDSFTYTLTDGNGGTSVALVAIAVAEVNDLPSATDDFEVTDEDTPVDIDVLGNDTDPDGDELTVESVLQPLHGNVVNHGFGVTYVPAPDFNGEDEFTYTARDIHGGKATATAYVTITPRNDPPVAQDDSSSTQEDVPVAVNVLANDSDLDGDALVLQSVSQPVNGSVVIQGSRAVYTPNPDFNGLDTFTYTMSDGSDKTATAVVTITVIAKNDSPIAENDEAATDEETPISIDVLANDTDPDGDSLFIEAVTQPSHGVVENLGTSLTYAPSLNFSGTDTLTYSISDGQGGTETAIVTIRVNPVNDRPTAQDDSATTEEDTLVAIFVISNDSDPDGDFLLVESVTSPINGSVINADNSVSYIPDPGFNGVDSFTYTISDGNGGTATATVHVAVTAVNDPPVAEDDSRTTNEDTPIDIAVLANDNDPDGDSLVIQSLTQPTHGSAVKNASNIIYTPDPQFHGIDVFTYTVSDGNGGTSSATATIDVTAANDPPVAQDDSDATDEGIPVTVDVLANDSDVDGDPLVIQSATQPAHGSVSHNGVNVTYTPSPEFNGVDSFSYIVADGNGGTASALVTIAVAAVNDPPTARDDSIATNEDTPIDIAVLANDSDPDGDILTIQSLIQPTHGSAVKSADTISYTPDSQFNGVDVFTYAVSDGNGGTATATVTINVAAVNDPPVAQDDSDSTDEGAPVVVNVLENDSDLDGDGLIVQSVTQPSHGSAEHNGIEVTYTPAADFNGVDSFSYEISDGHGGTATATVSIAVAAVNDPPIAQDDSRATDEDTSIDIAVLANDSDPDGDSLSIQSLTQPAHGLTAKNVASISYTPDPQFNGVDVFTYIISDGNGGTASATVTVAVTAVNDLPVAQNDSDSTDEGSLAIIDVLANDSDLDGDDLIVQSVTQPAHGIVVNNGLDVAYTPDDAFNGTDTFTYTISDGHGGIATATVTIAVAAVNDPPVAQDDTGVTNEGAATTIQVLGNDSDPDGNDLAVQSVTQPAHGSVINNTTYVTYTPDANFNGLDTFTYTITDGQGETATATVTVTVASVNDAPSAQDDSGSTTEGAALSIDVLQNDSDPDGDALTIQSSTQPVHGTVVNNGNSLAYTPNPGFSGVDTFEYTISDNSGETATASVTIAVAAVNDPPVALDDSVTTGEDQTVTIQVLPNDSDPDLDTLFVQSVTQPLHGTVVSNGTSIIYTPAPNYVGIDSFTYTVSDGNGGRSTASVAINVLPVNDAPIAQDDSQTTQENSPVTILVLSNDSDPDSDALVVESVQQPANGRAVNTGTDIVYTPNLGFSGTDSFVYTVADQKGGKDTARVTVLVSMLNDPPVAQNDSASTDEEVLVVIPILANDSDPDGDFLLIESYTQPANGTVINSRTNLSYIPNPGYQGIDTFTYTVSDGNGGSSQATVTVSVAEVNDAPLTQDDSAITDEGNPTTILPLLNDSDPDGDPLTIESVSSPDHGTVEIISGQLVYTPDPGFDGVDTFTYTVSDGRGGTSTSTVFVAVAPVNDAPIAQNDSATTIEDAIVSIPVLGNDSDPDGDPLVIVSVTQPTNGTVAIGGSELLYEPNQGFSGTDTFQYTIADDSGSLSTATVTIGVDPLIAGAGAAADNAASCEGRVIISEIAWAGTAADARDEWIELRNLGTAPVDLSGWVLRWRSNLPSTPEDQIWKVIELEGTLAGAASAACDQSLQEQDAEVRVESFDKTTWLISAHATPSESGYYVLERRTDNTIQDTQANQIYDVERTLSLDLSDLGEIVMLVNEYGEVVDTANAANLGRNGWVAGSTTTRGSMERIDPLKPDNADNWQTNFGLVIAGDDSAGHPLRATPGITNSPDLGRIQAITSVVPASVRAGEILHADFSLTRQDRRVAGWPWISVVRPGFTGSSGAGGAEDYTAYAFSGSYKSDDHYALEIGTGSLSTGSYSFWIIYGSGQAVYMPVIVSP